MFLLTHMMNSFHRHVSVSDSYHDEEGLWIKGL